MRQNADTSIKRTSKAEMIVNVSLGLAMIVGAYFCEGVLVFMPQGQQL